MGAAEPLWHHHVWTRVAPLLDAVVHAGRSPIGVRSTQTTPAGDTVVFGRLGFSAKAHARWTHGSPDTARKSARWRFVDAEVWAPHWNVCAREHTTPDVFVSLARPVVPEMGFDQGILIAVDEQLHGKDVGPLVRELAAAMRSVLVAHARLPWGKPGESLQEFMFTGLYYPGVGKVPEVKRLGARWRAVTT